MSATLDVLAIAAHRDDSEQTCGGTLLKMAQAGHRTGILDLTQGEMGTRGTAEERAAEAKAAAKILQVAWRDTAGIPDARVENTWENRLKIARVIREQRPRVVILPYWEGRHPDHYTSSKLGYEACFLAGLAKLDLPGKPHRPFKIVYATLYYDIRPSFVVHITAQFEKRLEKRLPCPGRYSQPRGSHGPLLRHVCGREIWRAFFAEGSGAGGRPYGDSGEINLIYRRRATATPSRRGMIVVKKSGDE